MPTLLTGPGTSPRLCFDIIIFLSFHGLYKVWPRPIGAHCTCSTRLIHWKLSSSEASGLCSATTTILSSCSTDTENTAILSRAASKDKQTNKQKRGYGRVQDYSGTEGGVSTATVWLYLPLYTNFMGSTASAVATTSSALCLRPLTTISPSILPTTNTRLSWRDTHGTKHPTLTRFQPGKRFVMFKKINKKVASESEKFRDLASSWFPSWLGDLRLKTLLPLKWNAEANDSLQMASARESSGSWQQSLGQPLHAPELSSVYGSGGKKK